MQVFNFKRITPENVYHVCDVHRVAYLEDHFSSRLNNNLLSKYYLYLIENQDSNCFICYDQNGCALGFVISGENLNQQVKKFVNENFFSVAVIILKNPMYLIPKLKSFFTRFSNKKWKSQASFRVLSIAVTPESQGSGVGKAMLEHLDEWLCLNDINKIGLSVKITNEKARSFYEKKGYELENLDKKSAYYIRNAK